MTEKPQSCDHEFKRVEEVLHPERTDDQIRHGMAYQQGPAYLVWRVCEKCGIKTAIDMRVEA